MRAIDFPPQMPANAGLRVFGAKMPTPFFFMAAAFFLPVADCAALPLVRFSAVIFFSVACADMFFQTFLETAGCANCSELARRHAQNYSHMRTRSHIEKRHRLAQRSTLQRACAALLNRRQKNRNNRAKSSSSNREAAQRSRRTFVTVVFVVFATVVFGAVVFVMNASARKSRAFRGTLRDPEVIATPQDVIGMCLLQ